MHTEEDSFSERHLYNVDSTRKQTNALVLVDYRSPTSGSVCRILPSHDDELISGCHVF